VDKQAGMTDEIRSLACFVASIRIERQRRCIIMDILESTKKAEWMEDPDQDGPTECQGDAINLLGIRSNPSDW
jgi:hypothetical protein